MKRHPATQIGGKRDAGYDSVMGWPRTITEDGSDGLTETELREALELMTIVEGGEDEEAEEAFLARLEQAR